MAVKKKKSTKKSSKYTLETFYLGESIDLKKVQESIKQYVFLTRDFPLVVKLQHNQYAVLTKFGTVTFWNVPPKLAQQFIKEINPFVHSQKGEYQYSDNIKIYVSSEMERVTFERVYLKELDLEKIQIISYVSAQSVALERYENEVGSGLADLEKTIDDWKLGALRRFGQDKILKQIGNALSIKQTAITHLALFDKPESTWENPEIEKLYLRLRAEYELQDRFDILSEKISFLSENNTTLLDFLSMQRANFLELIVVVLIVVELVVLLFDIFPIFKK